MNRMEHWRIVLGGEERAERQMPLDEALAREGERTVRFFTWRPAGVSLGWKQPQPAWLNTGAWAHAGLALVERPTGGGLALHGTDLSVSVVVPRDQARPLASLMEAVCRSAARVCRSFGAEAQTLIDCPGTQRVVYCLAEPSSYAVLSGGRKLAGFALRRFPESWLIQGSLLVRPLARPLADTLPAEARRLFEARARSLSDAAGRAVTEAEVAEAWASHWSQWWNEEAAAECAAVQA